MALFKNFGNSFLGKYLKFRSSIYGQVIYIIALLSIILFVSFGVIFKSVNEDYMKSVIQQSGTSVSILVEGSLYYSMLENDKKTLQNTLQVINTLPGISDVNMYDSEDNLVYTSISSELVEDSINRHKANCKICHTNIGSMFHHTEKSYKVINTDSECEMNQENNSQRHLFVKAPILNQKSCYTSACHVHKETDKVLGSLIVKIPLENLDTVLKQSTTDFFMLATLTTFLLVLILIFFTRKKIKKPLTAILEASQSVANGNITTRLDVNQKQLEDIKTVSTAFNNMLDKLDTASSELKNWSQQLEYKVQKKTEELNQVHDELMHVERMASLGKLSLSVAHEINNPLSGVLTYTKLIHKQLSKNELDDTKREAVLSHLKIIEAETKRCGEIVKGLLDFSRNDQKDFEEKSLHVILRETYNLMTHTLKMANINFVTEFSAKEDIIRCSPNQIKQACIDILVNASESITENGEILIKTYNKDENTITLEIKDNGCGIAASDIPHIFEPFFSKKEDSSGIGLGLAVVHGIVQNHKGKVDVKSKQREGTTMSISLPLVKNNDRKN